LILVERLNREKILENKNQINLERRNSSPVPEIKM